MEAIDSELVITHLENFVMPFIRYKIGDRGILSEETCKCGRGLPIIKSLEGRTSDMLVTPSGKKVHSLLFAYIMKDFKGVQQFKIIQEDKKGFLLSNPNIERATGEIPTSGGSLFGGKKDTEFLRRVCAT